jgi:CheY-like chemotaxis protein
MGDTTGDTILIVDDEPVVTLLIQRYFEHLGYRALTATSGAEAIEIFEKHSTTVSGVILDLSMPGMSGEKTYDALVEIDPNVRILLTSGYPEKDSRQQFGDRPLAGFIQKPFRAPELFKRARALFDLEDPDSSS